MLVADGTYVRMYFPLTNIVSIACSDHMRREPIKFELARGIAISQGKIFVLDGSKIMVLTPREGFTPLPAPSFTPTTAPNGP